MGTKKGQVRKTARKAFEHKKKGGKVGKTTKAGFTKVLRTKGKPNSSWTVEELKNYIRSHKLNLPRIRLSQKKAGLVADLKKQGHFQ